MVELLRLFLVHKGIDECLLLGYSMGGTICNYFTALYPQHTRGLILLSSVGPQPHKAYRILKPKYTYRLIKSRFKPLFLPLLRKVFQYNGFPKGISNETIALVIAYSRQLNFAQYKTILQQIQRKTLVFYTENDPLIEKEIFSALCTTIPDTESISFPSGGHCPQKKYAEIICTKIIENYA